MATKEGLGWLAGLTTVGLVATSASNAKLEKESATLRTELASTKSLLKTAFAALNQANIDVADIKNQLVQKQTECTAAYADRNRYRECFDATTREARALRTDLDREAQQRMDADAQRDQERASRQAADARANVESTRANAAEARNRELEQLNLEQARELADLRRQLAEQPPTPTENG